VIRSVEIKGLRGIRTGRLTDFTPLVVLVGRNGSGKSTVIEGVLIGASPDTADAMLQVVRRHEAGGSGPRWLLWRAGEGEPTEIRVTTDSGTSRQCRLQLQRGMPEEQTLITIEVIDQEGRRSGWLRGVKTKYHSHQPASFPLWKTCQRFTSLKVTRPGFKNRFMNCTQRPSGEGVEKRRLGLFPNGTDFSLTAARRRG
jgi:hypothetical protein